MDQESRKNRRPPEFSSGGPAVFYVCRPFDAAAGTAAYGWVRQLTAGCGGLPLGAAIYRWMQRVTAGRGSLRLGAAVCRRGGGLPPGTVAAVGCGSLRRMQPLTAECSRLPPGAAVCRWMQQLTAGCSRLPLDAAAYRWVRWVTAGCGCLSSGDAAYFFPAA